MRRLIAITLAVFLYTTIALAQIPTKGNVFFGYSYSRINLNPPPPFPDQGGFSISSGNANGWNGSLEGHVFPHIGIVVDISGHYGTWDFSQSCGLVGNCTPATGQLKGSIYNVLFGPRVSLTVSKFTPFAHVLVGVSRFSGSAPVANLGNAQNSLAYALGGGVDYKLIRGIAWRVQLDSVRNRFFDVTRNRVRFSTGLVLRF